MNNFFFKNALIKTERAVKEIGKTHFMNLDKICVIMLHIALGNYLCL